MPQCKSVNCSNPVQANQDFCKVCEREAALQATAEAQANQLLSARYPKYYKDVNELQEVDVYAVHNLFQIHDHSGCIQHASKKLLLSGARTGGKSFYKDVMEARDTLTRWLELNPEINVRS